MTRQVTCGWETGDPNESGSTTNQSSTITAITSSPTPRSPGTYALKIVGAAGGTPFAWKSWTFPAPVTDVWTRFGFYPVTTNGECGFIEFVDSAGAVQGGVTWSPTDLLMRAYRGTSAGGLALLGTSSGTVSASTWHTIEVRWQVTSTTVGIVEVWIDGSRFLNLTGVDNTNAANANVQGVHLGGTWTGNNFYNSTLVFDDFAVNDTTGSQNNSQIGDGRVVLLKPTGAGSNTNQTRSGTDTGANWSQTSETPMSMVQYVQSATPGDRDTYTLQDIPSGSWSVNVVDVVAFAQNGDAMAGSLGLTIKSGATTNEGTAQPLTVSPLYYHQQYETDPNTGAVWTNAAVNALEAGTTVR